MNTTRKALVASIVCIVIVGLVVGCVYPYIDGQKGSTAKDATASPTPVTTDSATPIPIVTARPMPDLTNNCVITATPTVTPSPTPEPSINVTVANSSSGNVYVAVSGNYIEKYSPSGTPLMQIGSSGVGDDKFGQGPVDIAVDANGTIYTLDYQNPTLYEGKNEYRDTHVKVFAANGTYLYMFSSFGSADWDGLLNTPRGLTVDKNGNIYVADTDNFRVQKFSNNGTYIKQCGGYGSGKLTFEYPVNIAVDDSGCIYVVDMGAGSVQKIKG